MISPSGELCALAYGSENSLNKMRAISTEKESISAQLLYGKLRILSLYLIVFGLLWLGYGTFIVPVFGYSGFNWSPDRIKASESLLVFIIFVWMLPSSVKRPSDFFIHLHFLLPIVPMLVLYAAADLPRTYMYFVVLTFAAVCLFRKCHIPRIKGYIIPIPIMTWGLLILVAIYILSIILLGALKYVNFNLLNVYEFRTDASENMPAIAGYLSPLVSNILLPFLLLLTVMLRKWLIAALSITGSVMMFALTSHKGPLFYPFFALTIFFIMGTNRRIIVLFLFSHVLLILVSLLPFLLSQIELTEPSFFSIAVGSLGFRRGYFVPSYLNFLYYDFFSINPHTMWAESKLTLGLVDYPYDLSAPYQIGYFYFNNFETGANTGWLGSGYMHLGFAGMLLYAFVVGLLLATVDMLAKGRESRIYTAIFSTPFLALFISSDVPTVMLTHGFLLALFLTWVCQLQRENIYILSNKT